MKVLRGEAIDRNGFRLQEIKLNEVKMNKMHVSEYNFVQHEDF